ncbi:hypothetical protein JG687_00018359 [Phytophthora cactorum]|uniref:Uncharacterized protein n=1 Tax=Phytophthora cactorum TaxID=29920 RepID=A0A8T1TMY5_9STRA|nr:hypothetical protein JG687_00018359 [Phytophthora cactorum]
MCFVELLSLGVASDACRRKCTFLQLHGGKTSNPTKHLSETHQIYSAKTILQTARKRGREEEGAHLKGRIQDCSKRQERHARSS